MDGFYSFLCLILIILFCFVWRVLALIGQPHAGSDAYYYLLCIEEYCKNRQIPIVLPPYYTLENQEQWYPPGFVVFLSMLPQGLVKKLYWCISPGIDAMICGLIFAISAYITNNQMAALLACLMYVFSPAVIAETQSLTSRQLGVLFFVLTSTAGLLYVSSSRWEFFFALALFGSMLFLTHKFSTQAFIISFCILSLLEGQLQYVIQIVSIMLFATLLSGGYYGKVLYSHYDFIRFWTKNWNLLGAHQIEDSPIYRKEGMNLSAGVTYNKNMKGHCQAVADYLRENFYVLFPIVFIVVIGSEPSGLIRMLSFLALAIVGIGLISYLIPFFRGIGYMTQYGKYALPFGTVVAAYLLSVDNIATRIFVTGILIWFTLLPAIRYLLQLLLSTGQPHTSRWNIEAMQDLFQFIRSLDNPLILCLPSNYNDLIVYYCRKRVLWGTHTSPTESFQPVLPVLMMSVEDLCAKYDVSHLFIEKKYTSSTRLGIVFSIVWEDANYAIYKVQGEAAHVL